ncbi:hypothetical protein BGZ54_002608 [Gamsiella multidivaricata]|nr:hypothetical protein BGZ54_002608 [Gamsiella multidivaricata]
MRLSTALITIASALVMACSQVEAAPVVAGYLLLNPTNGPAKLKALADNADNIPINRIFLSFARPGMVYVPNSNTLEHVGLNYANTADFGFADLKAKITTLQSKGVEVFLSVGGWNYGCFPYLYTYYSVGGYGTTTPNYYKILENGGSLGACTEANMWCYTCEPKSEGTVLADFDIFPEPSNSSTWQAAQHNYFAKVNRDPYQDLVYLAKDLGLAGVDIDYEEMWHADYFRVGPSTGPWTSHQTVYKYAAIMRDVQLNIQAIKPSLMLATAASAAGGLSSNWWGGNLKNIWYYLYKWYPEVYNFMATGTNGGGVNVMTYDLSNNQQFHECPDDNTCSLSQQVNYYMKSYADNGMTAHVGYEIGIPAYPASDHDAAHQLPLTQTELSAILAVQGSKGGFFWELYKPAGTTANVDGASCSVAAWSASATYQSGAQVSYNGRLYTAQWWSQNNIPTAGGPWTDKGACGTGPTATSTTPTATVTSTPGGCAGVSAWSTSASYSGGAKVSYNGFVYTAQWWTQGEAPGSGSVWTKGAACTASLRRRLYRMD